MRQNAQQKKRDPWVRTFFKKETGISRSYRHDSYIDADPAVSLLRYAQGDRCCRIMRLIFHPWASFIDSSWQ